MNCFEYCVPFAIMFFLHILILYHLLEEVIFTLYYLYTTTTALFLMIGLMMPCFLFAMFEKDGLPFEKVLRNIIRTRFLLPKVRPYKTDNFYAFLSRKEEHQIADQRKDSKAGRRKKAS